MKVQSSPTQYMDGKILLPNKCFGPVSNLKEKLYLVVIFLCFVWCVV